MNLSHTHSQLLIQTSLTKGLLRNQCAYVLATAWHETGGYKWLKEIWGPTAQQKKYDPPHAVAKSLGNAQKGDGKKYMGRGFVQITGRRNYADWGKRLGLDLINKPHLTEDPITAARIAVEGMLLGTFTGKKLSDYVTLSKSDFVGARRIVNGTDKAEKIAGYAREFDALLKAAGYDAPGVSPATQPAPKPATPAGSSGIFTKIIALIEGAIVAGFAWFYGG